MNHNSFPNVIVFGETGAGKSSLINMFQGGEMADVSNSAKGVTFASSFYEKSILGLTFKLFDTVGLNEGSKVSARDAIEGLYTLIRHLEEGVSLLVYVMRAPRITLTAQQNYEMFYELFCQKQVPIVMVITGLEEEEDMDHWWIDNREAFDQYNMSFSKVACITARMGKFVNGQHRYETEYNESREKVERLVHDSYSPVPWKLPTQSWFTFTAVRVRNKFATTLGFEPKVFAYELYIALKSYGGLSDKEARAKAYEIEKKSFRRRLPFLRRN